MSDLRERAAVVAMLAGEFVDEPSGRNEERLRESVQWYRDRQGVEALIAFASSRGSDQ